MSSVIPAEALGVQQTVEVESPTVCLYSQSQSSGRLVVKFTPDRIIGSGSFGVVYLARLDPSGEPVAVKKVLQDRRYKNRELQIMRELSHPNVVRLRYWFFTPAGSRTDENYLNLIMDFVPESVYAVNRRYTRSRQLMPISLVRLLSYQLLRSLAYIHSQDNCCHRDVKPQNLLTDPNTGHLVLCDFGSAKHLEADVPNVSYICSRFYRAPELIFGATHYTTAIDIWSAGCVIGELLLGTPLFPGETGVDQLVEIIKVLGTPTRQEIAEMNRSYTEYRFPNIRRQEWRDVFRNRVSEDILSLVDGLLRYQPKTRLTALQALAHPAFDRLRDPGPPIPELNGVFGPQRMPSGQPMPDLFDFTEQELARATPEIRAKLIPEWYVTYRKAQAGMS